MRPLREGMLVETDVIIGFLTSPDASLLQQALRVVPCFTTVVNAAELLGAANTADEVRAIRATLSGMRVLGFSARYALTMGAVASAARAEGHELTTRDAMVAGAAIDAKLPVLTLANAETFRCIAGLTVVTPEEIGSLLTGESFEA